MTEHLTRSNLPEGLLLGHSFMMAGALSVEWEPVAQLTLSKGSEGRGWMEEEGQRGQRKGRWEGRRGEGGAEATL